MKVFIYYYGESIFMVFAECRQKADKIVMEAEDIEDYDSCTEYGVPNKEGEFVLEA